MAGRQCPFVVEHSSCGHFVTEEAGGFTVKHCWPLRALLPSGSFPALPFLPICQMGWPVLDPGGEPRQPAPIGVQAMLQPTAGVNASSCPWTGAGSLVQAGTTLRARPRLSTRPTLNLGMLILYQRTFTLVPVALGCRGDCAAIRYGAPRSNQGFNGQSSPVLDCSGSSGRGGDSCSFLPVGGLAKAFRAGERRTNEFQGKQRGPPGGGAVVCGPGLAGQARAGGRPPPPGLAAAAAEWRWQGGRGRGCGRKSWKFWGKGEVPSIGGFTGCFGCEGRVGADARCDGQKAQIPKGEKWGRKGAAGASRHLAGGRGAPGSLQPEVCRYHYPWRGPGPCFCPALVGK
jgi:hypothetical protein